MKNSKGSKTKSTLFYLASILFLVAALLIIVWGDNYYVGIICLGLGATFLCLGSAYAKKSKGNDDKKDK